MDNLQRNLHHVMRTVFLLLAFLISVSAQANNAGQVIMVKGTVIAKAPDGSERSLQRRAEINASDTIITGADSRIQIRFIDNALLALQENTTLHIHEYQQTQANGTSEKVVLELVEGGFRTLTGSIGKGNREAYTVNTPVASIGVRGTLYSAHFSNGQLHAGVWQGGIVIRPNTGSEVNLGRDSAFSFGTYSNNHFRGSRTPHTALDTGDQSDTDIPTRNDSDTGTKNSQLSSAHNNAPSAAPTPFDQQKLAVINNGVEQKFLTQNTFISAEELRAYKESDRYVVMIVNDKAIYGKVVEIENEPSIFMAIENGKLNTYTSSELDPASPNNPIDIYGIEHSLWDADQFNPIKKENNTGVYDILHPLEWVSASAFIPNENRSLHQYEFNGDIVFGSDSLGNSLDVGNVSFILDMATGRISDGDVSATYGDMDSGTTWNFNFSGDVNAKTGFLNTSISNGTFTKNESNSATDGIFNTSSSDFQGFLANPDVRFDGSDPNFIGWFNLQASLNGNTHSAYGLTALSPTTYNNVDGEIIGKLHRDELDRMGYAFFNGEVYRGAFVTENNKTVFYAVNTLNTNNGDLEIIFRSNAAITPVEHGLGWGAWGNSQNKVYAQEITGGGSITDSIQYADVVPYVYNYQLNTLAGSLAFTTHASNFIGSDNNGNSLLSVEGRFDYNLEFGSIYNGDLSLTYGGYSDTSIIEVGFSGGYEMNGNDHKVFEIILDSVSLNINNTPENIISHSSSTMEGMIFNDLNNNINGAVTAHNFDITTDNGNHIYNGLIKWNKQ